MPYQTGTASSPTNLLQTLVTWLVSLGWNQDMSQADGAGWRAHLDRNGNFVHLRAFNGEGAALPFASNANASGNAGIALYLSTAFAGGSAWNQQPGAPPYQSGSSVNVVGCGMALPSGAIQNYYFFADAAANNIVVVVEPSLGIYLHMGWGLSLSKCGSWTGGAYFFANDQGYYASYSTVTAGVAGFTSTAFCPGCFGDAANSGAYPNLYVRADVDSFTGKWLGCGNQSGSPNAGYTGKNAASPIFGSTSSPAALPWYGSSSANSGWASNQTSQLDGRANLLPIVIWAARDATPSGYSPLGQVPNVFYTDGVGNGFSNAQEVALGPTTYKFFPNFAVIKQ